jgi:hypothetical protein
MSVKPETRYIGLIHKKLPGRVYYEKMHNPYRSGTADVWYSGVEGDLWVEYKNIQAIPKRTVVLPDLSDRQKRWLGNRLDEGRNVAVVLGTPEGGVIYRDRAWLDPLTPDELRSRLVSNQQVADWIYSQTGDSRWDTIQ